jgi:integrase
VKRLRFGYSIDSHSCREVEQKNFERTCVLPIGSQTRKKRAKGLMLGSFGITNRRSKVTRERQTCTVDTVEKACRTMVYIAQCLGLPVSEIAALQWNDFDFEKNQRLVQRSYVDGRTDWRGGVSERADCPVQGKPREADGELEDSLEGGA